MNPLFEQLADLLGGRAIPTPDDYSARIEVDGVRIWCYQWRGDSRLYAEIDRPTYPDWRGHATPYSGRPGSQVKISVNPQRPVAHLANDIRRRLLPAAREVYPVWRAAADEITARRTEEDQFRALLVAMRGRELSSRAVVQESGTIGESHWSATEFVGSRCTLTVSGVSPALAEQIIMLVDEWREPS